MQLPSSDDKNITVAFVIESFLFLPLFLTVTAMVKGPHVFPLHIEGATSRGFCCFRSIC